MFIGRQHEIKILDGLYGSNDFRMAVVYGRRRVGKTALIQEFCSDKPTLFFTAQQKSDALNLRSFSSEVLDFFGAGDTGITFDGWKSALDFVSSQAAKRDEPMVFVFDELPYAAKACPSLPSILQAAIDRKFKQTKVCMILCGSNEGFMKSEVLGRESPLYGRRSAQIKLSPLEYREAAQLAGARNPQEAVRYYATFGGTPYYLEQIDRDQSYEQNVLRLFFDLGGILYAEPQMLLRQELREPALYSSILDAVGSGATKPKAIAERAGIEQEPCKRYLATLVDLGLVERNVPFGENPARSRNGIYRIADPFFAYWYRFVSPLSGLIEAGRSEAAARRAAFGKALSTFEGRQFKQICAQWLLAKNDAGELPLVFTQLGQWWGTGSQAREQVDIDIVAADSLTKSLLVAECKWRNSFNETEALETLRHRAGLIGGYKDVHHFLFMKGEPNPATAEKAFASRDTRIVPVAELYA